MLVDNTSSEASQSPVKGIPLIPTEAFAGEITFHFDEIPIEDMYTVSEFKQADFLIRVKGDSMSPKYNGGDIVACKKIQSLTFFQWHRIYVIRTASQGVIIKRVEPGNCDSEVKIVSENSKYAPFSLAKKEITDIALVLGAITLE